MLSILQIMAEYALCVHYKNIITPDNNKNYEFAFSFIPSQRLDNCLTRIQRQFLLSLSMLFGLRNNGLFLRESFLLKLFISVRNVNIDCKLAMPCDNKMNEFQTSTNDIFFCTQTLIV